MPPLTVHVPEIVIADDGGIVCVPEMVPLDVKTRDPLSPDVVTGTPFNVARVQVPTIGSGGGAIGGAVLELLYAKPYDCDELRTRVKEVPLMLAVNVDVLGEVTFKV